MKKYSLKRVLPYVTALTLIPFTLTGCSKRSECEIPTRHVHKYVKEINKDIKITMYLDSEDLLNNGYSWTDDYLEITKDDESFYQKASWLFDGKENFPYLYSVMAGCHDYLMFYYEYTTVETYVTTNSKGKTETHTRTVHHSGWTNNPYDSNNTGKTRLYHHKFYGYRIINENGKYSLKKSPLVDDIRDIIDEYPYYYENCIDEVYKEFRFSKLQLPSLSPNDFDIFDHPDLTNTSYEKDVKKLTK